LLFEIDEAIRDVAGTTRARELVVTRALTYLDRLAREAADDPSLAQELATAYMKIGDIQGSPYDPNIGKTADGLRSYEKANALLARVPVTAPGAESVRLRAAFGTGFMHHTNRDVARARVSLAAAIELAKRAGPGIDVDRITVARGYLALAFIEKEANNIAESARHSDDGLAYVATWDPSTADARYWRAVFLLRRAEAAGRGGDPEAAAAALTEIVALHTKLAAELPTVGKYPRERVRSLLLLAMVTGGVGDSLIWVAHTNEPERAEAAMRDGLASVERMAAEDADNADFKMIIAAYRTSLALLVGKRSPRDAAPILDRAFAAYDLLPATMRGSSYGRENEFIAHCAYAHSLAALGKRDEATARATSGIELAQGDAFNVAICESLVAAAYRELGERELAIRHFEAVATTLRTMVDKPDTAALIGLVETLEQLAQLQPEKACGFRTEALKQWRARPATTTYLRRRLAELEKHAACGH
jgi:non-specific serine/threonine protein kinase/serine/threonine-protein kinase